MACELLHSGQDPVPLQQIDSAQVIAGAPSAGVVELPVFDLACGLWEHTTGVSTDVEVDEVFVVLSGRARIEVEGEETLEVGPGDVVKLTAGARTTWTVTEQLRKFWVTPH